eukprot:3454628-Prymnesium_polylepis.1
MRATTALCEVDVRLMKVLKEKVQCRSSRSIHIDYNDPLVGGLSVHSTPARQIDNRSLPGGRSSYLATFQNTFPTRREREERWAGVEREWKWERCGQVWLNREERYAAFTTEAAQKAASRVKSKDLGVDRLRVELSLIHI